MTHITVPVERISVEARRFEPRIAMLALARVLGTLVLAVPYILGWTVGKAWVGLVMLGTALVVGWREAVRPRPGGGGGGEDG